MDAEATLARDGRLTHLEDTLFQADFYLSQALECRTDDNRNAILRITQETVRKALSGVAQGKLVDL